MDLGLHKIKTNANLWTIQQRIKSSREQILKTRPDATDYIDGALKSEQELLEAISFLTNLYEHSVCISRENTILASRNIELNRIVEQLKQELKFKNIENEF